jgi:hypothetical protein
MAKSKRPTRKRKPLPLSTYVARYGAPKKGTPRRAEYERSAAFRARSEASRRGRAKRIAAQALLPILGRFVQAREAAESHREVARAHDRWLAARAEVKAAFAEDWGDILDRIGDELGLDEDFIEALDESPDSEET